MRKTEKKGTLTFGRAWKQQLQFGQINQTFQRHPQRPQFHFFHRFQQHHDLLPCRHRLHRQRRGQPEKYNRKKALVLLTLVVQTSTKKIKIQVRIHATVKVIRALSVRNVVGAGSYTTSIVCS